MIDEFTFRDLSLDEVISKYRNCETSAGDDYFIDRIMDPFSDTEDDFFNLVKYFEQEVDKNADFLPISLKKIGKFKFGKFEKYVSEMTEKESESNAFHYFVIVLVLVTFAFIFVTPGLGFLSFLVAVAIALFSYFSKNKELAVKFFVYKYIIRMLKGVDNSYNINNTNEKATRLFEELKQIRGYFSSFLHGQFIIKVNESTEGNPIDVFLDYVRMIFHLDIIKYNKMHHILCEHKADILRLYQIFGMIDTAILIDKLKKDSQCCDVQYSEENELIIENGYHPLINNPEKNSINTRENILITGCNASGKSTFLKMCGVIICWGQAFGYTFADKVVIRRCCVLSSMAIKDSLETGESYFTAELNSIKRIIEMTKKEEAVFCIIDEILRGTNTVERIAASTEILKSLKKDNVLCFAATHDIELTKLLDNEYHNMHFSEEITESDVRFNYKIQDGPSKSRNAIRLLSIMGYDEDIVKNAENRANSFMSQGKWS